MTDPIQIIKEIEADKIARHIEPVNAMFKEILTRYTEELKKELNQAVQDGTLEFHRTLNDISFNTKS